MPIIIYINHLFSDSVGIPLLNITSSNALSDVNHIRGMQY